MQKANLKIIRLQRQLDYALNEEENLRKEHQKLKNEFLTEKIDMQKKNVELESQLRFVEEQFTQWKERALNTESSLEFVQSRSKLEVIDACGFGYILLLSME